MRPKSIFLPDPCDNGEFLLIIIYPPGFTFHMTLLASKLWGNNRLSVKSHLLKALLHKLPKIRAPEMKFSQIFFFSHRHPHILARSYSQTPS